MNGNTINENNDNNENKDNNDKNIERFPLSRLDNNWPFSIKFASDLFNYNKYGYYLSLKEFLIATWLETISLNSEDSEDSEDSESENEELNEALKIKKLGFWPNLKYEEFFIENNIVFFKEKEVINQETQKLVKDNSKTKIYDLSEIPFQTLICKSTKFYIDQFYEKKETDEMANMSRVLSRKYVWGVVFYHILFTLHSSSMVMFLKKKSI